MALIMADKAGANIQMIYVIGKNTGDYTEHASTCNYLYKGICGFSSDPGAPDAMF